VQVGRFLFEHQIEKRIYFSHNARTLAKAAPYCKQ
jgi:hypothetical protein